MNVRIIPAALTGGYVVVSDTSKHWCGTHAEALSMREALLREQEAYQYHEGGIDYDAE